MAIDFPASPTNGQTFVVGTVTYTWDTVKWTAAVAGKLTGALVFKGSKAPGDAAPGTPTSGDLWVMSAAGTLAASWTGVPGLAVVKYETIAWDGSEWISLGLHPSASGDKIEEGNTSAEVIDTGTDGRFVVKTEGTARMSVNASGIINFSNVPQYTDNAAALAGGLVPGDLFKNIAGILVIAS